MYATVTEKQLIRSALDLEQNIGLQKSHSTTIEMILLGLASFMLKAG